MSHTLRQSHVSLMLMSVMLFTLGLWYTPVQSQTDSTDRAALIERMLSAWEQQETHTNQRVQIHEVIDSVYETVQPTGVTVRIERTITIDVSGVVLKDGEEISGAFELDVVVSGKATNQIDTQIIDYALQAEVRNLDNTLYVKAFYSKPGPFLPVLPTDWVRIDDLREWPIFGDLYLGLFLEDEDNVTRRMIDDPSFAEAAIQSISVKPGELDDGTPVDIVTIISDIPALIAEDPTLYYGDAWNDMPETMRAALRRIGVEDHILIFTVSLDENNNIRETHQLISQITPKSNYAEVTGDVQTFPAGTTVEYVLNDERLLSVLEIDAPDIDPIEAPIDN